MPTLKRLGCIFILRLNSINTTKTPSAIVFYQCAISNVEGQNNSPVKAGLGSEAFPSQGQKVSPVQGQKHSSLRARSIPHP